MKIKNPIKVTVTVFMLCILIVLCVLFLLGYQHVRRISLMKHNSWFPEASQSVGQDEVSTISTWMTFDYINHLFGIPDWYFQDSLGIIDPRYPQLTLTEFSEDIRAQPIDTLGKVQNAVRTYFNNRQTH